MFHFTNICPNSFLELGLCKGIRDVGLLGDAKLVASVNVSMNDSTIGSLSRLYPPSHRMTTACVCVYMY